MDESMTPAEIEAAYNRAISRSLLKHFREHSLKLLPPDGDARTIAAVTAYIEGGLHAIAEGRNPWEQAHGAAT